MLPVQILRRFPRNGFKNGGFLKLTSGQIRTLLCSVFKLRGEGNNCTAKFSNLLI